MNTEKLKRFRHFGGPVDLVPDEHGDYVLLADVQAVADENTKLRRLLSIRVAGFGLYTDDGELQDNTNLPLIDFKRDDVDLIADKLRERTARALHIAAADRSRERFERACYANYLERHAAGKTEDKDTPPLGPDGLLWRREDGTYGVIMFNAAWWAWQIAQVAS